jgi:hypothetical protein
MIVNTLVDFGLTATRLSPTRRIANDKNRGLPTPFGEDHQMLRTVAKRSHRANS